MIAVDNVGVGMTARTTGQMRVTGFETVVNMVEAFGIVLWPQPRCGIDRRARNDGECGKGER